MARGGGGTAVYLQLGQLGGAGGGGARGASGGSSCRRPCPSPPPGSRHAPPRPRPGRMLDAREKPGQRRQRRRDGGDKLCPRRRRGPRALPAAGLRTRAGRGRGATGRGELPVLRPLPAGRVRARRCVGDRQQPRRAARRPAALGHLLQRLLGQGHGREHQPQVLSAAVRPHLQVSPSSRSRSRRCFSSSSTRAGRSCGTGLGGVSFPAALFLPRLPPLQAAHSPLLLGPRPRCCRHPGRFGRRGLGVGIEFLESLRFGWVDLSRHGCERADGAASVHPTPAGRWPNETSLGPTSFGRVAIWW